MTSVHWLSCWNDEPKMFFVSLLIVSVHVYKCAYVYKYILIVNIYVPVESEFYFIEQCYMFRSMRPVSSMNLHN